VTKNESLVKVGFRSEGGQVETLWAFNMGGGKYRLDNTPWYQYGVSYQDVIETVPEADGFPFFVRVFEKSGHRTIRVRSESEVSHDLLESIKSAGASFEGSNKRLIAIDIPPGVDLAVVVQLVEATGIEWEYADPTYEQVYDTGA
jgi:Domain of unknown function (DUF4265)